MSKSEVRNGLNIIGYFEGRFGLAESARLLVKSLENNNIPVSAISADFLLKDPQRKHFQGSLNDDFIYSINLFCLNPRQFISFVSSYGWGCIEKRYNIGMYFWETNIVPKYYKNSWNYLDEIWAPTRYIQEHFSIATTLPVYRISQPLQLNYPVLGNGEKEKKSFNLESKFTFLFCFCFHSMFSRKNPLALVQAFKQAFPLCSDVQLVIKSQNGIHYPEFSQLLSSFIKNDHRIVWLDEILPSERRYDLIQACDCYISLHRSEGFGLTMAEAMLMNKPVIATGYSGNLDFMNEANSFLCSYKLQPIGIEGGDTYSQKGIWADVDIEQAARLMKFVFDHPHEAKSRANLGQTTILNYHSSESVGQQIQTRLAQICLREKRKRRTLHYIQVKSMLSIRSKLRPIKKMVTKMITNFSHYNQIKKNYEEPK